MPSDVSVGVVANPASGRDIRRLVAGASVFGNSDKAAMVLRVLAGLGAAGVGRALMMPAGDGLSATLRRLLDARAASSGDGVLPALAELDMQLTGTAADTTRAVAAMRAAGVAAIVVLGGDGTHRVVAKGCGDVPLCALSTGTNNAFPAMREATVAGVATGLLATGRAGGPGLLRRETALRVEIAGREPELALVDVAVSAQRFAGARALWHADGVGELFVTFADPAAVGLSSVAGQLRPTPRGAERGVHVRLAGDSRDATLTVRAALAPGLVASVGVVGFDTLELHEARTIAPGPGCLALDGEREIERRPADEASVRLVPGPLTIDVDAVMRQMANGLVPAPSRPE